MAMRGSREAETKHQGPEGSALPSGSLGADPSSGPRRAGPRGPPIPAADPCAHRPPSAGPLAGPGRVGASQSEGPPTRLALPPSFLPCFPERPSAPPETPQARSSHPAHTSSHPSSPWETKTGDAGLPREGSGALGSLQTPARL